MRAHDENIVATTAPMIKLAKIITIVSYLLNIPPLFIWVMVILRNNNVPASEAMAAWLSSNFSMTGVLVMWLMMPSSALIFGLGSYAIEGKKVSNIGVVILSTILLFGLAMGTKLVN